MKVMLVCLVLCFVFSTQAKPAEHVADSHGTVNVILANRNGLVAVVDSMLTRKNDKGQTVKQEPNGMKLFKVDDETICTMAGFYSFPGALNMDEFAVMFPAIVGRYVQVSGRESLLKPLTFSAKVELLERVFTTELRNSFTAYLAFNPAFRVNAHDPIILTLAGYDLDGSLKIAEFELKPARSVDGVSIDLLPVPVAENAPSCEAAGKIDESPARLRGLPPIDLFEHLPPTRTIGDSFFCEIAGLDTVATKLLAHPELYPEIRSLHDYALSKKTHRPLSTTEMRVLALDLEKETANDEATKGTTYVGGDAHIGVLEHGQVTEAPPTMSLVPPTGSGLRRTPLEGMSLDCMNTKVHGIAIDDSRSLYQATVYITRCAQQLDGILFHDSSFTNSVLTYDGSGPLLFPHSNSVVGSALVLGPSLKLDDPLVKDLMCYYPWKTIEQSQKPVVPHCT
jgi:hypothetical protein